MDSVSLVIASFTGPAATGRPSHRSAGDRPIGERAARDRAAGDSQSGGRATGDGDAGDCDSRRWAAGDHATRDCNTDAGDTSARNRDAAGKDCDAARRLAHGRAAGRRRG